MRRFEVTSFPRDQEYIVSRLRSWPGLMDLIVVTFPQDDNIFALQLLVDVLTRIGAGILEPGLEEDAFSGFTWEGLHCKVTCSLYH